MEKEVVKMLAEEIRNASRDLVDEQRRLIRRAVEEDKQIIREVVEQEKLAIRATVEETRQAIITSIGIIVSVARQEAEWIQLGQESGLPGGTTASTRRPLSPEARELVAKIDEGGIPLTITRNLERIASEHGIQVSGDMTPNDLVSRLRNLA
jgi:hypothetical protein